LATTQDSLGASETSTMTPLELWQKADESLKIIEESLIAQGEPVENLSKSLPELYQKSQELQESVNALSQRFGSFEEYLTNLDRNMSQAIQEVKASKAELITWKILAIASVCATITIALRETIREFSLTART